MNDRRLRILQVYSTRYPQVRGGVDTMIVSLVDQLRKEHDVMLFAAGEPDETDLSCTVVDGIKTYAMHLRLPYYSRFGMRNFVAWLYEFPRTLLRIRRIVREERIDVIHLHMLNRYHLVFVALSKLGGPPYVVTLHGSDVNNFHDLPRWTRLIGRIILRHARRVAAVSRTLAEAAPNVCKLRMKIDAIPNGVDISGIRLLPKAEIEMSIGMPLPQRYFTVIGALLEIKAQDVAIRAWAALRDELPDIHLFLVGDGAKRDEYRALIDAKGCSTTVHLTGHLPRDVALSLARSGLGLIVPSRNEGLPYVLLEAGPLHLPVLCSDIPPLLKFIANGKNGIIFPVEDPEAISEAVWNIVTTPGCARKLGDALAATIDEEFSSKRMATAYAEIYRSAHL